MPKSDEKKFDELMRAVRGGDTKKVASILAGGLSADAFPANALGYTALMVAVATDATLDMVKLLVENGSASLETKSRRGETPISLAEHAERRDLLEYFASRGAKVSLVPYEALPQAEKDARLFAALQDWTHAKLAQKVTSYLERGASPNAKRGDGHTPITALIAMSANVTPVYQALLERGADPKATDENGNTALHALARQGSDLATAKVFLAAGTPLAAKNVDGDTALHLAASAAYWDAAKFVKMLLDAGANATAKNAAGKTPAELAKGEARTLLLDLTSPKVDDQTRALLTAVAKNDAAEVSRLCASGANPCMVDVTGKYGDSGLKGVAALHLAFTRSVGRAVREALLAVPQLDCNVRSVDGQTPLHILVGNTRGTERMELLQALLARGADPLAKDGRGRTALWALDGFYEGQGDDQVFELLLAKGVDLAATDDSGETVLDHAFEHTQHFHHNQDKPSFVRMLKAMLDRGAKTARQPMKSVEQWFAAKAPKYLGSDTPAKPTSAKSKAPGKTPRDVFDAINRGKLGALVGKDAYLEIDGEKQPIAAFDWYAFQDDEENDESTYASEIWEYHIPPDLEDRVKAEALIPFAIVGMTGSGDSYEEMGVDGTLFLDLSRAKGADAPVLYAAGDEPRDVAKSFVAFLEGLTAE